MDDYNNMNQNQIGGPSPSQGGSGLAIASMVLGILALICSCYWPASMILSIIGLILGIISIKKGNSGKGMAIAGVVLSIVAIVLTILFVSFLSAFIAGLEAAMSGY